MAEKPIQVKVTGARTRGAVNAMLNGKPIVVRTPVNMDHPGEGDTIEVVPVRHGDTATGEYDHLPQVKK